MPFSPSAQCAKNVGTVIQETGAHQVCSETNQKLELDNIVLEVLCGDWFADVECVDDSVLNVIHTKTNLLCNSPIEIPYYSAENSPI